MGGVSPGRVPGGWGVTRGGGGGEDVALRWVGCHRGVGLASVGLPGDLLTNPAALH